MLKPSLFEKSRGIAVSSHSSESVWIKDVYRVIPQKSDTKCTAVLLLEIVTL